MDSYKVLKLVQLQIRLDYPPVPWSVRLVIPREQVIRSAVRLWRNWETPAVETWQKWFESTLGIGVTLQGSNPCQPQMLYGDLLKSQSVICPTLTEQTLRGLKKGDQSGEYRQEAVVECIHGEV